MRTVNIKDTVHERIKKEAEKTDLSISTVITIAFNEYIQNKYGKGNCEKNKEAD